MKNITTAFNLTPEQDKNFRIAAAKAGLSKTKLAQQIICNWLDSENTILIKQQIESICSQIASLNSSEETEQLYNTIDRIIAGSCDYIEMQVKLNTNDDTNKNPILDESDKIVNILSADIKIINDFCLSQGIPVLTQSAPTDFAMALVKEYFEDRSK